MKGKRILTLALVVMLALLVVSGLCEAGRDDLFTSPIETAQPGDALPDSIWYGCRPYRCEP